MGNATREHYRYVHYRNSRLIGNIVKTVAVAETKNKEIIVLPVLTFLLAIDLRLRNERKYYSKRCVSVSTTLSMAWYPWHPRLQMLSAF